jgi:hypothetical protein
MGGTAAEHPTEMPQPLLALAKLAVQCSTALFKGGERVLIAIVVHSGEMWPGSARFLMTFAP